MGNGLVLLERYTEHARRSIFFARYEPIAFGTLYITCEELLPGILREDKSVAMRVGIGSLESIRNELERSAPPKENRVSTSVDLPLSQESRRALQFAEEEADALGHKHIDAPHLLLGLLRIEDSVAAELLRKRGIEYEQFREIVARGSERSRRPIEPRRGLNRRTWPGRRLCSNRPFRRCGNWWIIRRRGCGNSRIRMATSGLSESPGRGRRRWGI